MIKQKERYTVLSPGALAKVVRRSPVAGIAVVGMGLALAACGGGGSSGPSAEQVAHFKRQGAEHVHKEVRMRRLERELKGMKHKVATTAAPAPVRIEPSTPTTTAVPAESTPSTSIRSCDQNISASEATSCPLAENVFVSYWEEYESYGEEPETYVTSYSPTSQQSYGISCTFDGTTVDCTGGSDIFVTFPMWAVRVY